MQLTLSIQSSIVKRGGQYPLFVAWSHVILRVIAPQACDESCKGREPTSEEDAPSTCYQLVNHSVIVRVNSLQFMLEVVEEEEVVMLTKRIKKCLVTLVGSYENSRIWRKLIFGVFEDFFSRYAGVFELEVPASNMEPKTKM